MYYRSFSTMNLEGLVTLHVHVCVLLSITLCVSFVSGEEVVNTEYGRVVGQTLEINLNPIITRVTSFYGVPYAAPPLGELRFAPPQKHSGWTDDLVADSIPSACMQSPLGFMKLTHPHWTKFSEDCLTLNIFKPRDVVAPLPVIVWFHGGGYQSGSAIQYPGHFMAARDIIVVTVNYRLGVFGFASTRERNIPGNMGLLDQIMALEFVRDNIVNFGGNPNRVTIAGESAGAGCTSLHLISPKSRGLFHQGILESGAESNLWVHNAPEQDPDSYIFQVAEKLNCTYNTEAEMVACLRGVKARDLRIADRITCTPGYFCQGFEPIVDGPGGFLPDRPTTLREQLGENSVPLLSGITKDDGSPFTLYFIPESLLGGYTREEFQTYLHDRLLALFAPLINDDATFENVYQAFNWFYTPWPYIDDLEANRQAINKLLTDAAIMFPWDRNAKLNSAYRDTYTYILSYISPNSSHSIPQWMGVPHAADVPYVWGYSNLLLNPSVRNQSDMYFDFIGWTEEDILYGDYMQILWTNFVKYGNPTPSPVKAPFDNTMTTWPKFSLRDNLKVLNLDWQISAVENYRQPDNYFYTQYLSYLTRMDIKKSGERPVSKVQWKSSQYHELIARYLYEFIIRKQPEMNRITFQEFLNINSA